MFVITHRSIAFPLATLPTVLSSTAWAKGGRSTSDASTSQPAIQSGTVASDNDDADLVLAEPDFRVLNLPSTLRLPVRVSNFQLTQRFNGNLRQGSVEENASNLFGLDQGAVVGFEYRFGVARPGHDLWATGAWRLRRQSLSRLQSRSEIPLSELKEG